MIAIRGAGRAFCTGIDLKALAASQIDESYFRIWEDALRCFETMDKLVLCLIHGHGLSGGLQMALACDIRVATVDASLALGSKDFAEAMNAQRAKRRPTWC